jgi:hypothetical protein
MLTPKAAVAMSPIRDEEIKESTKSVFDIVVKRYFLMEAVQLL